MSNVIAAYLSLGSNQGNSRQILDGALQAIGALPGCRLGAVSKIYLTEPQGYESQPWFHNLAAMFRLAEFWEPLPFLGRLLDIETSLGRKRSGVPRFGPRKIDIDLLLFGDQTLNLPECQIPHPRMHERAFVLYPLREIAPGLSLFNRPLDWWLGGLECKLAGDKIHQGK